MPCRENCSAAAADRGVVSCSGGFEGAPAATPSSSSLSLPSFSPFSGSVKWLATKWRRGDGANARATEGRGFYSWSSKLPWRMTERLVMCREHRTALGHGGGCVGAALRWGTGSCDVRDPGPASAPWSAPGRVVEGAWGRRRRCSWAADRGGPFVSLS